AELQNPHARHAEAFAQFVDLGGDEAEIFRDEGKVAEYIVEALEKLVAGGLDPLTVDGGLFVSGDGPVGLEAAEVVEADHVIEREGAADARNPPVETTLPKFAPAVERIAPALAAGRKVVGRDTGDPKHMAFRIKLEELRMRPDVG